VLVAGDGPGELCPSDRIWHGRHGAVIAAWMVDLGAASSEVCARKEHNQQTSPGVMVLALSGQAPAA